MFALGDIIFKTLKLNEMKKISTLLLFVISSIVLFAQENDFERNFRESHNPNQKYDIFQNDILEPHRQGEKIWVNDSIVNFDYVGDDQWLPTDLYRVMTRNGYGSNTSGIKDKFDFDLFEWVPNYKDTTVYYFNNTKKSYLEMKWNEETKEYSDTSLYIDYNEAGDYVKRIKYGRYKALYFYDENGNDTLFQYYRWNTMENNWYLYFSDKTAYNEEGLVTVYIFKAFDFSVDSVINYSKYIYYIENGITRGYTKLLWDKETESWNKYQKREFYYNDSNLIDSVIIREFNDDGVWGLYEKLIYSFNTLGKYKSEYSYKWDSIWVNSEKEIYKYINDEYLTEHSYFDWNSDSLRWDVSSKYVYTYDDNFNNLTYTYYTEDYEGVFDKFSLTVYSWSEFEVSGIEENDYSKIDIFPNPMKDYFTLDCESVDEINDVNIYSMQGKSVRSLHNVRDKVIDIQDLGKGLYIIEVNTIKGKKYNKIIKY